MVSASVSLSHPKSESCRLAWSARRSSKATRRDASRLGDTKVKKLSTTASPFRPSGEGVVLQRKIFLEHTSRNHLLAIFLNLSLSSRTRQIRSKASGLKAKLANSKILNIFRYYFAPKKRSIKKKGYLPWKFDLEDVFTKYFCGVFRKAIAV